MQSRGAIGKRARVVRAEGGFPVRFAHAAGIDVGSREHFVAGPPGPDGKAMVRSFGTTTGELETLADWLKKQGVQSVAMESTGVYWIPLFELLESRGFEAILVDARQIRHVPGRKTDVIDCQWLQMLHASGLLRGAFRPPDNQCRVRSLIRQKGVLVRQQADWLRRMQKSLDQMNVKVHRAVTDIGGSTGMAIIRAIVQGERDPLVLAQLRDPRCQKSQAQIAEELKGTWRAEHLFNLAESLRMYEFSLQGIERYDREIEVAMRVLAQTSGDVPELPDSRKQARIRQNQQEERRQVIARALGHDLTRIDGYAVQTAETILGEIGAGISRFPTERHFVSFIGLSPGIEISGGKPVRRRGRGSCSSRVGAALRMAALTLRNSKTALGAYYRRISRRKGASVAVFATARKLAVIAYRMLRFGIEYVDPGEAAFDERFKTSRLRLARDIAKQFGFTLLPVEAVP
jgi:transposase